MDCPEGRVLMLKQAARLAIIKSLLAIRGEEAAGRVEYPSACEEDWQQEIIEDAEYFLDYVINGIRVAEDSEAADQVRESNTSFSHLWCELYGSKCMAEDCAYFNGAMVDETGNGISEAFCAGIHAVKSKPPESS